MSDFTPKSHATIFGQKTVVENVGVKRIAGTELLTRGKQPNFLYYLEDIKTFVTFANDGTEVWYSAIGQPAAGSVAFRDSLVPFEGQRFYVIEEDISYEYKGGSWTGTVFEGNLMSPTILHLEGPSKLTVGRDHLLDSNGTFVLPTTNVKDMHEVEFTVYDGNVSYITTEDSSNLVIGSMEWDILLDGPLLLSSTVIYKGVYFAGQWNLFYSASDEFMRREANLSDVADTNAARTNLGVLSAAQTDELAADRIDNITIGTGLIKSGSSAQDNMVIAVNFATPAESTDLNIFDKVLAPGTVIGAVNVANRENQHNNITGLLPADGETKFEITGTVGGTTVTWPQFTCAFNPDPYVRSQPLQLRTFLGNTLVIPVVAGVTTHFLVARDDGTVVLQTTRPLKSSVSEVLLGGVITLNGNIIPDNLGNPAIGIFPRLASSDYALRNSDATVTGGVFTPSATVGKLALSGFSIFAEGINWESSVLLPHTKTIPQADPARWLEGDRNGNILNTGIEIVDGQHLDDGVTVVGNNNYSIQIMFTTVEGDLALLMGQSTYATIEAARADVFAYSPIVPSQLNNAKELARWVVRGNQYPGSPSLDLTSPTNFVSFSGLDVTQATTPSNAADITSSNVNNNLQSTNLQEQIDELSRRGQIEDLTGQAIERSKIYRIAFSGIKKLPAATPAGQVIGFYARATDLTGILEVNKSATETLFFASAPGVTDTSVLVDTPAQFYWLRSLGTSWEITNA